MADLDAALVFALKADAAILAVVGTKVFPALDMPQDTDAPYITYQLISKNPDVHQLADSTLRRARYQFNCYAPGEKESYDLARLLEAVLHVFSGTMGDVGSEVTIRAAVIDAERAEWTDPTDGTQRGPHWTQTDYVIWYRTT